MTLTQTLAETVIHAWNAKDKNQIFNLYTPDFVREDIGRNKTYDLKALSHVLDLYWEAFPDLRFELLEQIESEHKIGMVWKMKGTQRGVFMHIPPTNKVIEFHGTSILYLRGDKICKVHYSWDEATMLRQMGLLPNLR
jgi:steroid delta-isomerase-like uncharacterized protein